MLNPPAARFDLAGIGLVVDPPLAPQHELEMLDRVGDVDRRAVDSGLLQSSIEDRPRWPDEGPPGKVLLIPRLLSDKEDRCIERPLAEDRLRRAFVEIAAGAAARILEEGLPCRADIAARFDPPLDLERVVESVTDKPGHRRFERVRANGVASCRAPF
jgi:hypothetical protein